MSAKLRRQTVRCSRVALAAIFMAAALGLGCSRGNPGAKEVRRASAGPREGSAQNVAQIEDPDQRDAQRVWCDYLEALYHRASSAHERWSSREECLAAETMASPEMLRKTAQCSHAALDAFEGDPFTREYAAAVNRCGASALDACEVGEAEVAPFVATICAHLARCGDSTEQACREGLANGTGPHLERALGAMNHAGRARLGACLKNLSCGNLGSQVTGCLEPIMERLLWLPG